MEERSPCRYSHCVDFAALYSKLVADLASMGIKNADEYRGCHSAVAYIPELAALEYAFANQCTTLLGEFPDRLLESDGLVVGLVEHAPKLTVEAKKKLCVYSETAVALTGPIKGPDVWIGGVRQEAEVDSGGADLGDLLDYVFAHYAETSSGILTPVPKGIETFDGDSIDWHQFDCEYLVRDERELFHTRVEDGLSLYDDLLWQLEQDVTRKVWLPNDLIQLSVSGAFLRESERVIKLGLILPSLRVVPLPIARKLRRDYAGDFLHFQAALSRIARRFEGESDERKMRHIVEEVDDAVRDLERAFESIGRVHKTVVATTGLMSIVFCLIVRNPDIASHIHALLSGIGTATYYECLRDLRAAKATIDQSPFAFPRRILQAK